MTRLDIELVRRGLARSRGHARALVTAGSVRVQGVVTDKPAATVQDTTPIELTDRAAEAEAWVGRAAYKLLAALERFGAAGLSVAGRQCLDVGASTGGFTQVLLRNGARQVVALDVGHGQLAPAVAADPRVSERSGVNIRAVSAAEIGGPFELVVADLSFISLTLVTGHLGALTRPTGDLVLLVKPQFEVGRARLGKNGIVRDPAARLAALRSVVAAAAAAGLGLVDLVPSPIPGGTGNREYLGWWTPRAEDWSAPGDVERLVAGMESER